MNEHPITEWARAHGATEEALLCGGRWKITESHRDDDGTLVIDAIEPDVFPPKPDTITITISRENAHECRIFGGPPAVIEAIEAALEGER